MGEMKKFIQDNFTIIVLIVMLLVFVRGCSERRDSRDLKQTVVELEGKVDSLMLMGNKIDDLHTTIQIENLKTAKRILYDWNSVVRTVIRPDDRMNEYDREIEELRKR